MAGLAAAPADGRPLGDSPDALSFVIDRTHYRFALGVPAAALLAAFVFTAAFLLAGFPTALVVTVITVIAVAVAFRAAAAQQTPPDPSDPVLLIGHDGIFDRRLTPRPIPWSKIRRIYVDELDNNEMSLPNVPVVAVDVGSRESAGLETRTIKTLGPLRVLGGTNWDEFLIDVQGLLVQPPRDDAALARRIADYANTMRRRHSGS